MDAQDDVDVEFDAGDGIFAESAGHALEAVDYLVTTGRDSQETGQPDVILTDATEAVT